MKFAKHTLGNKQYELTNYLGNILLTVSDNRRAIANLVNPTQISHYQPYIKTITDYYPFGMPMAERSTIGDYCTTTIPDPILTYVINDDFNDGTLQNWLPFNTTILFNSSNCLSVSPGGGLGTIGTYKNAYLMQGTAYTFTAKIDKGNCLPSVNVVFSILDADNNVVYTQTISNSGITTINYTFTANSSGMYKLQFIKSTDKKNCTFLVDNVQISYLQEQALITECTPYEKYRFSFNGKERDNEGLGGAGSTYDYGFRIYNPALGKFLSIDPLTKAYPMLTPYQFASNRPIDGIDMDGLEWSKSVDANGNTQYTIVLKVKNSAGIKQDVVEANMKHIKQTIEGVYNGQDNADNGVSATVIIDYSSEPTEGDFYVDFVNTVVYKGSDGKMKEGGATGAIDRVGDTESNRIQIETGRSPEEIGRTGAHEIGHTGGLDHPDYLPEEPVESDNIMYPSSHTTGTLITPLQLTRIENNCNNGYSAPPDLKKMESIKIKEITPTNTIKTR